LARQPDSGPTSLPLIIPPESVAFDGDGFDMLIRANGVRMVHWRAMACPVGRVDPDDIRKPHPDHAGCSNGYLLTRAGVISVSFSGNSKTSRFEEPGRLDGSTADVILPRWYDGHEGDDCACGGSHFAYIAPFDRVYLEKESVLVPTWEMFAASGEFVDKLRFPVKQVVDLVDSKGNRLTFGRDFELEDGRLRWLPGKVPPPDPSTGLGAVLSARYLYRPYWYVQRLPHEVRMAHVDTDSDDPDQQVARLPQNAALVREYVFENQQVDDRVKTDARSDKSQARQAPRPDDRNTGDLRDLRNL
jgi:hypothetical protein